MCRRMHRSFLALLIGLLTACASPSASEVCTKANTTRCLFSSDGEQAHEECTKSLGALEQDASESCSGPFGGYMSCLDAAMDAKGQCTGEQDVGETCREERLEVLECMNPVSSFESDQN